MLCMLSPKDHIISYIIYLFPQTFMRNSKNLCQHAVDTKITVRVRVRG